MVTEFLLLMVFLEKTWFTPVGEVLDKRDKALREKLGSVKVRHLLIDLLIELYNSCRPKEHDDVQRYLNFCTYTDLHGIAGDIQASSSMA